MLQDHREPLSPPTRNWLERTPPARRRRWALEEQLLHRNDCADLLAELERQVRDQARRLAELERRFGVGPPAAAGESDGHPAARRAVDIRRARAERARDSWLTRCDGFLVDSPTGTVGIVEGVRFFSRVDRPDQLEIRTGWLRTELIVVPVEDVEHVSEREEHVVLRRDPRRRRRDPARQVSAADRQVELGLEPEDRVLGGVG